MQQTPINKLVPNPAVRIAGRVVEIYGNKLILQDATGRTLVELGPRGAELVAAAVGNDMIVDGRYHDGFMHGTVVITPDNRRFELKAPEESKGAGPKGPGPKGRHADVPYDQTVILSAVDKAGFKDAKVVDIKKHHAKVSARDAVGKAMELHVEFDGHIRKQEQIGALMDEVQVKLVLEKAGYTYAGSMTPHKKHMIVTARNSRGELVDIDVHRDGTIKKERARVQ